MRYAFWCCLPWRLSSRKVGKTSKWLSKTVKSTCAGRSDGSTNDALKRWNWIHVHLQALRYQQGRKLLSSANMNWNVATFGIDGLQSTSRKQIYLSKGHLDQNAGSFIFWLNPFPFQVPIERRYCDYIFNTSVERQRLNIPQLIALFGDKSCKSTWPQKVVYFAFASNDPFLIMFPSADDDYTMDVCWFWQGLYHLHISFLDLRWGV